MSSNSRGGPPIGRDRDRDMRYGSGSEEFGKRRKNYYASSTRRDFKSTNSPPSLDNPPPQGSYPSRSDKPSGDYGRSRYRHPSSSLSNSGPLYSGRPNTYGKDSRYSGSKPNYNYSPKFYSDRGASGAYGSYNASKRDPSSEYYGYSGSGRDFRERDPRDARDSRDRDTWDYKESGARDIPNNARDSGRDLWRSERPKTSLSASGPSNRTYPSSRYNSHNNAGQPRNSALGSGSLSSSGPDFKRERYDYDKDDSYSSRWKLSYGSREKHGSLSGSRAYSNKEKRSSGLTNSLGRGDSYYPQKSSTHPNSSGRFQDRYTDRYSDRRGYYEDGKANYGENYDEDNEADNDGYDYDNRGKYLREELREPLEKPRSQADDDANTEDLENESDYDLKTLTEDKDDEAELEAKKISESVVHDLKAIEAMKELHLHEQHPDEATSPATDATKSKSADEDNLKELETNETKQEEPVAVATIVTPEEKASKDIPPRIPTSVTSTLHKLSAADLIVLDYPHGCYRPLTELDAKLEILKAEYEAAKERDEDQSFLRFSLAKPLTKLEDYPFFKNNLANFASNLKHYRELFDRRERNMKKKRLSLWIKYNTLEKDNDRRGEMLDEQLKIIHPPDDDFRRELESIDIRAKNTDTGQDAQSPTEAQPPAGRRGRRHGDLVTTEAEFQEILKSLENEQNEDPLGKAQRVAAKIPDLILDPVERKSFIFMDSNNIVHDKENWASRIKSDFMDNFTEKEHDAFCEAFCRAPKRFGEISRLIGGLRTPEECVVHYYMTKKAVNYKFLVSQFKKRSARKPSRRKSKLKEPETPSSNATDNAPIEATDSGKDTEAPLTPDVGVSSLEPVEEAKRKRDTTENNVPPLAADGEHEAPPKKKAKRRKEEPAPTNTVHPPVPEEQPRAPITNQEYEHASIQPAPVNNFEGHANGSLADDKRKTITSYWSITEVNDFPHLLSEFGSKWSSIAKKLTTKSATMVRNYYQRNAEKNGWQQLVLEADARLAQNARDPSAQYSNVDATIVVKPQRRPEEHVYSRKPDEHIRSYDFVHPPKFNEAPVGTFHHPYTTEPPKRASVGSLLSGPPPGPYEQKPQVSALPPIANSLPQHVSFPPPLLNPPMHPAVKHEGTKPSIMSLLNSDSSLSLPTSPRPQVDQTAATLPPPAPAPARKPGNLASLLNASSSPVRPPEAPQKQDLSPSTPRKNSIKSLLHDS